ncbi:MAG TPA: hypothetical protein VFS21_29890 [Roseiflexaceae bacterium]|nr:hypothetical protein [Roseiflexaceae bacterium]
MLAAYTVQHGPAATPTTIAHADVLDVSGNFDLTRTGDHPLAPGDAAGGRATIQIRRSALPSGWRNRRVRVSYTIDGTTVPAFTGVITGADGTDDTVTLTCESAAKVIRKLRAYSPLFVRRPAATVTTAASVENPSAPGYRAGLINWILWMAGWRPLQQAATYPAAPGYYDLEQAIIEIDFAWVAGNDAWEEAGKLARASAGYLYVGRDGVIRYRQPLTLAAPLPGVTLDEQVYATLNDRAATEQTVSRVLCPYVPRRIPVSQTIVDDDQPRLLEAGASTTVPLEPQWPIYGLPSPPTVAVSAYDYRGTSVSPTVSVDHRAQRIVVTIANPASYPIVVTRITVTGRPIQPGEQQTEESGAGDDTDTLAIPANEHIQRQSQASRLSAIYLLMHAERVLYTASGCPFNPAINIGDVVRLSNRARSLVNEPVLVLSVRHSQTGLESEYTLCTTAGLLSTSDVWLVGETYASGDTRQLSY